MTTARITHKDSRSLADFLRYVGTAGVLIEQHADTLVFFVNADGGPCCDVKLAPEGENAAGGGLLRLTAEGHVESVNRDPSLPTVGEIAGRFDAAEAWDSDTGGGMHTEVIADTAIELIAHALGTPPPGDGDALDAARSVMLEAIKRVG